MTEEHKRKIQEGRKKALEEKKKLGLPLRSKKESTSKKSSKGKYTNDKPVVTLKGTETDSVSFKTTLRQALRPMHLYDLCKEIEKEISNPIFWKNRNWIIGILEKYVYVENKDAVPIEVKVRKKSSYIMTPEHKEALRIARENKKKEVV